MKVYKEEKRKVKRRIYHRKKGLNAQFEMKPNQDESGDRKFFWKEVSKVY